MNASVPEFDKALKKPDRGLMTHAELGMLVMLASFGMLFGTLILSYLLARIRVPVWPPIGVDPVHPLWPSVSTALLLASSFVIHQAQKAFENSDRQGFRKLWMIAAGLGLSFIASQILTWAQLSNLGVHLDSSLFGSIVYTMTGMHALHVLGGIIALSVVWMKSHRADFFNKSPLRSVSQAPKLAAWYWHFMDAVWVLIFVLLICF